MHITILMERGRRICKYSTVFWKYGSGTRESERSGKRSGTGRKSGGAERSVEREVAERERSGERGLQK